MARVASLSNITKLSDPELDRLTRRLVRVLILAALAFAAFYAFDRWKAPVASVADREITRLEAAVRATPADLSVRGQLGDAYLTAKRYADAVTVYGQILDAEATPQQDHLAHFGRARAYLGLEQYPDARADLLAVVDVATQGEMANVDPTLEAAYYHLGAISLKEGDAPTAVDWLDKALRINRADADALYLIGQAYTQTGTMDRAELALRRAVAFVPIGWPEPYLALVETFTAAGRPAMAEWASAMALVAAETPEGVEARLQALAGTEAAVDAAVGLGLLYETLGDTAAAAAAYADALALDPTNDAALLGSGRVGAPAEGTN